MAKHEINEKTVPNKYFRYVCYILLFWYIWDITDLLERYLPMQTIYKVFGLGWTRLGFYIFWLLWFIMLVVGLYHLLGEEAFNMLVNEIA
jgi:hypothetical protein